MIRNDESPAEPRQLAQPPYWHGQQMTPNGAKIPEIDEVSRLVHIEYKQGWVLPVVIVDFDIGKPDLQC